MKNFFRKILSISMVAVLLLANSGLAIFSHTCMLSGSTRLSISPPKTCRGDVVEIPHGSSFQKQGCCTYGFSFLKASHSLVKTRNFIWNKLLPVSTSVISITSLPGSSGNLYGIPASKFIPPLQLSGIDLLNSICILRI